jgi:hypothetical protein
MNQEYVKEKLRAVYKSSVDYTVIFSGKRSARVIEKKNLRRLTA